MEKPLFHLDMGHLKPPSQVEFRHTPPPNYETTISTPNSTRNPDNIVDCHRNSDASLATSDSATRQNSVIMSRSEGSDNSPHSSAASDRDPANNLLSLSHNENCGEPMWQHQNHQ